MTSTDHSKGVSGRLGPTRVQSHATGIRPTLQLIRASSAALIIEIWVEPHIYLHEARLAVLRGLHAFSQPASFGDRSSAVWRQIMLRDGENAELSITWTAIANLSPGAAYECRIAVRDERGNLLDAAGEAANPLRIGRMIGPEAQPTDLGEVLVSFVAPPNTGDTR